MQSQDLVVAVVDDRRVFAPVREVVSAIVG